MKMISGWNKYYFVNGSNECFYGISYNDRRVLSINEEDKGSKKIGPDLLGTWQQQCIVGDKNGYIYSLPLEAKTKIFPEEGHDAKVHLEDKQLPGGRLYCKQMEGALAKNECNFCFQN